MKEKNIEIVKGNIAELDKYFDPRVRETAEQQLELLIKTDASNEDIIKFNKDIVQSIKDVK